MVAWPLSFCRIYQRNFFPKTSPICRVVYACVPGGMRTLPYRRTAAILGNLVIGFLSLSSHVTVGRTSISARRRRELSAQMIAEWIRSNTNWKSSSTPGEISQRLRTAANRRRTRSIRRRSIQVQNRRFLTWAPVHSPILELLFRHTRSTNNEEIYRSLIMFNNSIFNVLIHSCVILTRAGWSRKSRTLCRHQHVWP